MRKFLLTFEQFPSGDVEVGYNENGELVLLDLSAAGMSGKAAVWMFRQFPLTLPAFFEVVKERGWGYVEATVEVSFEDWWKLYDNKINKKRCLPIWNKLPQTTRMYIYLNTKEYNKYLEFETWRSKSDPEGYLKKGMYETDWKELLDTAKRKRRVR